MKKLLPFCILFIFASCQNDNSNKNNTVSTNSDAKNIRTNSDIDSTLQQADSVVKPSDSAVATTSLPRKVTEYNGDFYCIPTKNVADSLKKAIKNNYSAAEQKIIFSLNRIDLKSIHRADSIIIPKQFADLLSYSPFPATISSIANVNKIAFFSNEIQAYGIYEKGNLVKWGPTSTGSKAHPTPANLYFTNWKGRKIKSTENPKWILQYNFNLHNSKGIGWHQYDLPGFPASHSCLRLLMEDAEWLYTWADQWVLDDKDQVAVKGTPTIVIGAYKFGTPRPWFSLLNDARANDYSESQMNEIAQPYLDQIMEEQAKRTAYHGAIDNKGIDSTMTQNIEP